MKKYSLLATIAIAACASGNAAPKPVTWSKDADLAPVLTAPELGRAQMAKVDTLASLIRDFDDRLGAVVTDTTNPPLVRSNAILLIADRRAGGQIEAFLSALEARDENVRAAAVVGLRNYLSTWTATVDLLKPALRDPSPLVQARVLETLADNEPDLLREYIASARNEELRGIARDLVLAAESRGAPLTPVDSAGALRRAGEGGAVLSYRPSTKWSQWSSSVGSLSLAIDKAAPLTLSDSVEVVHNVLPAFFSADGKFVVYESSRNIYVRDVSAGTTRLVGPGIAPRVLPFSNTFVFARERSRTDNPDGTSITYDVFQSSFAAEKPTLVGRLGASARITTAGAATPIRWARIVERDGHFVLTGEAFDDVQLPDPFASSAAQ